MTATTAPHLSPLTDEQRAAAHAPHSVAVTAGAGTGKTHMLAERYLFHLTDLNLSPLNLVAVTFTNDAAAELRSRIRRQVAHRFGLDSDEVAEVDAAQISTFHNLAARICREQADVLEIPPDFKILEDIEGQLWYQEQLNLGFHQLHQVHPEIYEIFGYTRLRSLLEILLQDPLKARQAFRCTQDDWLKSLKELQDQEVKELLENEVWQDVFQILESHQPTRADKLEDYCRLAFQGRDYILAGQYGEAVAAIVAIKINCGVAKSWGSKETLETVKQALIRLRALFKREKSSGLTELGELLILSPNELDQRQEDQRQHLRIAFEFMMTFLDQAKKSEKILEFNDLERYALQALESEDILDYYQWRWRAFLVDEFQDTNSVQGELLEQLTKRAILTIVGDDKQAIYGFRGGDVNVFRQWRDRIIHAGKAQGQRAGISLTLSFRSHQKLVETTNQVFRPILKDLHQDLRSIRSAPEHENPVEFHYLDLENCALPEGQATRKSELGQPLEAHWLADTIQALKENSFDWRDMVVLGRTWDDLVAYEQALKRRNIPIYLARSSNLLESREALDAIALLRFIADPRDNLALISLLRSPFFAVSDRALYDAHQQIQGQLSKNSDQHNRSLIWWDQFKGGLIVDLKINSTLPPEQDGIQPAEELALGRAIVILKNLLKQRYQLSPTQLLQLADQETGYTAAIANLNNAQQRLAHWRGFHELVRQLQGHSRNPFAVVRTLKALMAQSSNMPGESSKNQIPTPPLEAGNVVMLQTLHGSKGLEWPVVFLPDLTKERKSQSHPIFIDEHLGIAWKEHGELLLEASEMGDEPAQDPAISGEGMRAKGSKSKGTDQSCHYRFLKLLKIRAEAEELKRLYYVGFTRARDRLYVSSQMLQKANTALEFLKPALESANVSASIINPDLSALESGLTKPEFAPPPPLKKLKFNPRAIGSGLTDIPVVGLGIYAQCPRWFEYQIIENRPWQNELELLDFDSSIAENSRNGASLNGVHQVDQDGSAIVLDEFGDLLDLGDLGELDSASISLDRLPIDGPARSREARKIGLLAHLALEHKCRTVEALEIKAKQHRMGASPTELDAAIALAENFWSTPLYGPFWQPFQGPNSEEMVQREVPLTLTLGSLQLVGIADYVGPDFVLDFKTGDHHPEHDFQVWAYARALGRDRAVLAYLKNQTLEELSPDRQNALAQEAQHLAAGISQGNFAPKTDPQRCPTCPYLDLCEAGQDAIAPLTPSP